MIVRNGSARLFPDLFLGVQIRGCYRIFDNFQARMSDQQCADSLTAMPGRTIPKQEDRHSRESVQDKLKMGRTGGCRQILATRDHFTPGAQVERAIKAN